MRIPLLLAALILMPLAARPETATIDVAALDRERILAAASNALACAPISITQHRAPLSEGGPNDFFSMSDYYWPDPAKPDGKPYVQRDGQSYTGLFNEHRKDVMQLRDTVAALAAAYKVTGEEQFAAKAAELLRTFFVDPATRMNPNLEHAQVMVGKPAPTRGIGIIDTLHLIEVPMAIRALEGSKSLTPDLRDGLRGWFHDYLVWLRDNPRGKSEAKQSNNHAVAFWLQVAAFCQIAPDDALLAECRRQFKEVFIPVQMAEDGSFPLELKRTKPYAYSIFQLDNMAALCQLLSTPEHNLWTFEFANGRSMHEAMAYLYPYLADKSKWPLAPDVQAWEAWPVRQSSLLFAGQALGDAKYLELWKRLKPDPTLFEIRRNNAITQPVLWLPPAGRVVSAQDMLKQAGGRLTVVYPPQLATARRLTWFQEAKVGMFIHWGIYSPRGGIAPDGKPQQHGYTEWYQKANRMSHADYAKLADGFKPRHFDADRWAQTAKQAGLRYVTFTSKHHDGFCLFDSAFTRYDVVDATPFGRDVVRELREACDRHGLKLCLYYSHCQDWEQWDAWQTSDWIYPEKAGTPVDHERYLAGKCLPQIEELCRKYRPDGLWFDTPWFNEQKLDRAVSKRISDTVRRVAPDALINSRLAHGSDSTVLHADLFDYLTLGDQALPDASLPLYAESPDSITVSYGFDARPGVQYRDAPELLRRLIQTVAGGGNYLLNVGPDGEGDIPPQAVTELERIGAWLRVNGEAIYGTQPNPLGARPAWGEVTVRGNTLYLFPLRHRGGELVVTGLRAEPRALRVLGGATIPFTHAPGEIRFALPASDPASMPVALTLECAEVAGVSSRPVQTVK